MSAAPFWVFVILCLLGLAVLAWDTRHAPLAPRADLSQLDRWDGVRTDTQRIPVWEAMPPAALALDEDDEAPTDDRRFWVIVIAAAITFGMLLALLTRDWVWVWVPA